MSHAKQLFLASLLVLAATAVATGEHPAAAQAKPKQLGSFGDWEAYTLNEGKSKVCYIVSRPKSSEPKAARRGDIYVLVSHRPAEQVRNEVSINAGYPFKKSSTVEAVIGSDRFELVTFDKTGYEDTAWAPDTKVDQALVDAMAKGLSMVIKGQSERGTQTTDTYSLSGVTAGLKAIGDACK